MQNIFKIQNTSGYLFDGYFSDTSCGWTALQDCAAEFPTYNQAYRTSKKINDAYGRKVCGVVKVR